jgi:hypothetical protein
MSYFVFGYINLKDSVQKKKIEKEIPKCAKSIGLFALVNDEIEAECIKDILELFPFYKQSHGLTFLISESKEHNTSDSLISPFDAGLEKVDEKSKIDDSILKIDQLQKRIFENPEVKSILIFLVEGFDNKFKEINVTHFDFGKTMSELHSTNPNYWQSLLFKVSR